MRYISSPVILLVLLVAFISCKSTQKVAEDPQPVRQQQMNTPTPSQETIDYYTHQPRKSNLDVVEMQQIVDYAKRKASIACRMQKLEEEATTEEMAAENKRKIVALEGSFKTLDAEINNYMDREDKWHYFYKVYNMEMAKCK